MSIRLEYPGDILSVADLDADGYPDAVVHHVSGASVSVLFFDPALGSFATPVLVRVGRSPVFSSSGDLDGNGLLDLVVQNYGEGNCSVLLHRSPRSFEAASKIVTGGRPRASALGDMDGDGDLDLAFCVLDLNTVELCRGDGRGGFERSGSLPLSGPPHTLALEDLDGDRLLDLAVPVFTLEGAIHLFRGKGGGLFSEEKTLFLPGKLHRYCVAADFDADGRKDLAVTYLDGVPIVLRNLGAWEFGEKILPGLSDPTVRIDTRTWYACLRTVDFDSDGDTDLMVRAERAEEGGFRVYRNDGSGEEWAMEDQMVSADTTAVTLADFSGDGFVDALAASAGLQVVYLAGTSPGRFTLKETVTLNDSPRGLAVLRSFPPRIAAFGTSAVHVVGLSEAEGFQAKSRWFSKYTLTAMASGNFDGLDGDEIALLDLLGPKVVLFKDPLNDLSNVLEIPLEEFAYKIAVADFDGDGIDDLALGSTSSVMLWVLARPGTAGAPAPRSFEVPKATTALAAADLDGDGASDLVQGTSSDLRLLFGDGRGEFPRGEDVAVGLSPRYLKAVDLDRDGAMDILALGSTSISIVWRIGDPASRKAEMLSLGSMGSAVETADLNADGKLDIAIAARDMGAVAVFLAGPEGFGSPNSYGVGSMPADLALEDLDGDGAIDAATADYGSRAISVLRGLVVAALFRRGDVDFNGKANITDAIAILGELFLGRSAVSCPDAADTNDDGKVNLTDAIFLLMHLFQGGAEPPEPGPSRCGRDPTADALAVCEGTCS